MGFEEILGHHELKEHLGRVVLGKRVGSAYLFIGPEGVGRRLTALAWIALMNCEALSEQYPFACGTCRPCRLIAGENHPDVMSVHAEEGKELKIDQVRALLKEAHYRPYEGRKRAFIIDNADRINLAAANALLKTLEEPSETLVLILIAESEGQVISTIRSRCQIVRFGALPVASVAERLMAEGAAEHEAKRLALESSGSLGNALATLRNADERNALRREVAAFLQTLGREPLAPFRIAERFREEALPLLQVAKSIYRDALFLKAQGSDDRIVNPEHMNLLEHLSSTLEQRELADRFLAIELAERRIDDMYANKQLVLETLFQSLAK